MSERPSGPRRSRSRGGWTRSSAWLKELDGIAGWIVEQDLRAPGSFHDVVAEPEPGGPEPVDLGGEVVDYEVDPVPAAGSGLAAVGHRSPGRACRSAEQQPQVTSGDIGEGRRRAGQEGEAEMGRVEGDGFGDVVHHVSDIDRGHGCLPPVRIVGPAILMGRSRAPFASRNQPFNASWAWED